MAVLQAGKVQLLLHTKRVRFM